MAKFKFSLQSLLELRRRQEQSIQRELGAAERHRISLERRLHEQQREMVASRDILRSALTGRLEPGSLRLKASSSLQAMRLVQQIARDLANAHQHAAAVRGRLTVAARQRRAIELLRDRRLATWKSQLDRAEANAMDELGARTAAQRRQDETMRWRTGQ